MLLIDFTFFADFGDGPFEVGRCFQRIVKRSRSMKLLRF